MASYFLPSYFQKRLLRYALSQLDFLETDTLDLEDLGITWGQRSVVELKNVGIQVTKLAARLPLPPTISFTQARTRLLRLTVPADLNHSGILVEIEGVEVQVRFNSEHASEERAGTAPSRGSKANRPRISSPAVHDPGGQVIPSSQDLAVSFLQSEPVQERQELQAIIESQSQQLQESVISSTGPGEEVGLGMPGGMSLPSFVANFFKGIADRMSVAIRDVSITVNLDLPQDGTEHRDPVSIIFKMEELVLNRVQPQLDADLGLEGRRSIDMHKIEVLLKSEPELLSPVSATSSPKLSKSRSKLASTGSRSSAAESDGFGSIDRDLQKPSYAESFSSRSLGSSGRLESSSEDSPTFASTAGLGLENIGSGSKSFASIGDSMQSLQASQYWTGGGESQQDAAHDIDNQAHAEQLARTTTLDSSTTDRGHGSSTRREDLSESRVFTHDEAESMYLSAVSGGFEDDGPSNAMPGAWNWSSSTRQIEEPTTDDTPIQSQVALPERAQSTLTPAPTAERESVAGLPPQSSREARENISAIYEAPEKSVNFVAKRIFLIDTISVTLPTAIEIRETLEAVKTSAHQTYALSPHRSPPSASHPAFASFSSQMFQSQAAPPEEDRRPMSEGSMHELPLHETGRTLEVQIGDISAAVDLPVGKLLVRICQEGLRGQEKDQSSRQVQPGTPLPAVDIRVRSAKLNICESVPSFRNHDTRLPATAEDLESHTDSTLLEFSISVLRWAKMSRSDQVLQHLTIGKINFGHESKPLLFFRENLRSSTASVLPMLNDLTLSVVPSLPSDRIEVRLKPVHITLDLLQLDDVLSRSGGLSSILELGSSIVSTNTVRGGSPQPKQSHVRQRSVRFESSTRISPSTDITPAVAGKLDLRLGGLSLDLVGSETAMQVKTSAIKVVYRQKIAGLQIDRAVITGPAELGSDKTGDIDINMTNIRLQYLTAPEENDLDRLLTLLSPSNDKYDEDDDIMVDTLLRQRRKGGVLRLTVSEMHSMIDGLGWQSPLTRMADELTKLSSVTKYLPDDDRPGILTFILVKKMSVRVTPDTTLGPIQLRAELFEAAHVNVPSLMAAQASTFSLHRNDTECIISEVLSHSEAQAAVAPPMLMCRFIADEMEPMVKIKLSNTCVEYRVSTLVDIMEMVERLNATSRTDTDAESPPHSPSSFSSENSSKLTRRIGVSVVARDSAIGLSPSGSSTKGLFLLTDATFATSPSRRKDITAKLELGKASIMIIDEVDKIDGSPENADQKMYFDENDQVQQLVKLGFVPVGYVSSASAVVRMVHEKATGSQNLDIEFRNNLFILETCADSTQTLIQILSNLSPPSLPSKATKYRTEIVPIEDMLASFTGNAYVTSPGPDAGLRAFSDTDSVIEEGPEDGVEDDEKGFFPTDLGGQEDDIAESYVEPDLARSGMTSSLSIAPVGITESVTSASHESVMMHSLLDFRSNHFSNQSTIGGTAHRWNSSQNTYGLGTEGTVKQSPLKVKVRDVHIIWNLFDGYDWQSTRDTISQAVKDIEIKAASKRPRSNSRLSPRIDDDDESVIGDFLFNSIYIGIPASKNLGDLTSAINHNIDDLASETGSYATSTTVTASPTRQQSWTRPRQKKLRLTRSKHHKMTFELKGISADLLVFPLSSDEAENSVESSIDVRVRDLEIFDHVPTSTWKKFATYMQDAGEREVDTNMLHVEILNVKPVADLAASEMVVKITVLPLRLHVDQDALDFMARFFEFKDDRAPVSSTPSIPPFLQRVEVNPVRLLLDFKPKRVDYGGLRSGRTTEFMNFFVLDRADIVLRRIILYGVSGFDRLGIMLNNIWTPDVKRNQLPGILSSLGPVRPLTDVGSGLRELVVVPMREYKKDGRIVRSIQKGAVAFATTTAKELVNFGAKLAIGTQTVLQNAETMLGPAQQGEEFEDDTKKQISLYADQPIGIVQGLRGAYASLERDLLLAKDAIIAVPGEVMASGSATGAAKAVLRSSPTIILRPAIGASKAVGQTLLGAGNAMDRRNLRRMEEKYKHGR